MIEEDSLLQRAEAAICQSNCHLKTFAVCLGARCRMLLKGCQDNVMQMSVAD